MKDKKVLIECIPNYSEGRNPEVLELLRRSIEETEGINLLDFSADKDHNRCVFTFIGSPASVRQAIMASAQVAMDNIDLEKHNGAHPRIGAIDVVPLVPLRNITMPECVELAREIGREIALKFEAPVYLYEEAALRPERRELETIRKGNYEGLKDEIDKPERKPDFGPAVMHPTFGACIIGARKPLIAFNVNLATPDLSVAKAIARRVRAKTGGLAKVKAIGVPLGQRGQSQVSMNMVDYTMTALYTALEMVRMEARRYGVAVVGSEIVGLLPQEALIEAAKYYLQLEYFDAHQILENHSTDF